MTDNGQITSEQATMDERQSPVRLRVDPELLTPRDMLRAKTMLGGRNPYEVAQDPAEAVPLTIWCLMSRDNPAFTWDEALDFPFAQLDMAGEEPPPPPGGPPTSAGPEPATRPTSGSKSRRPAGATAPS